MIDLLEIHMEIPQHNFVESNSVITISALLV